MPVRARRVNDAYFELVKQFPLRRIKTPAEHKQALALTARYLGREDLDQGVLDYLEVLTDLIVDYERRSALTIDASGVTPAQLVRHLLAEHNLTITALARETGIRQSNLSEMLRGKREWNNTAIKALSERFSLNPLLFLS